MIILDTDVVSALMQPALNVAVVRWLDQQPRTSIWTTSVTVFEIWYGLGIMSAIKKQIVLQHGFEVLLDKIGQRIAVFDAVAAAQAAELAAFRKQKGRSGDLRDTMIAGIALAHHGTLATRNVRHFEDLRAAVVNPWIE